MAELNDEIINLTLLPEDEALRILMEELGVDEATAKQILAFERGEDADDVQLKA